MPRAAHAYPNELPPAAATIDTDTTLAIPNAASSPALELQRRLEREAIRGLFDQRISRRHLGWHRLLAIPAAAFGSCLIAFPLIWFSVR